MPCVCLCSVIMAFPCHIHLLFKVDFFPYNSFYKNIFYVFDWTHFYHFSKELRVLYTHHRIIIEKSFKHPMSQNKIACAFIDESDQTAQSAQSDRSL